MTTDHADNALGEFLRSRRLRLDPDHFGFAAGRRRTPGLRREEVAALANISPTWYTWLEQGRGGSPSRDVLERIAGGLMMSEAEREHLFLLAFGHPPSALAAGPEKVTARLQGVLDALIYSPAIVRTRSWEVVAWNRAATKVMTDYSVLTPEQRNVLRRIFTDPQMREIQADWQSLAYFMVSAFRADIARTGMTEEVQQLVTELSVVSPEFEAFWRSNDVAHSGEGQKRMHHPVLGELELEFTSLLVDGQPELSMMIFNPATAETWQKIRQCLE